jgi:ferredoxin-thioredoxin reductase catalytic chain
MSNNEVVYSSELRIRFDQHSDGGVTWYVNPDKDFRQDLEDGLLSNYKKYGFYHCPCRDTEDGDENNKDVACPCRYAEDDIVEWGQCYCGLFVSKEFHEARTELGSIPERRKKK